MNTSIVVEAVVRAPLEMVWDCWIKPENIVRWAFASDEWEALAAENDVRVGGRFKTVMAAKDKSVQFDFTGTYTNVREHGVIEYTMDDGRCVKVGFTQTPDGVRVVEMFNPEKVNSKETQHAGWQAILENFRKYAEGLAA